MAGAERRRAPQAVMVGIVAAFAVLLVGSPPADAHEMTTAGAVTVVSTLGRSEVSLTMTPPVGGAGPMPILAATQGAALSSALRVRTMPAGDPDGSPAAEVSLAPVAGSPARGVLRIDRAGAWEVELVAGHDIARIPVFVADPLPTPMWAWVVRVGLVAAVLGLLGAAIAGRRRRGLMIGSGAGALVGVSIVVTASLLSTGAAADTAPAAPPTAAGSDLAGMAGMADMSGMSSMAGVSGPPASTPVSLGMPGAGAVMVTTTVAPPDADGLVVIGLALSDGSTGAPVDDLVVHDDALMHLAIVGPGGRLWHVHPVRVAPGRYSVRLPLADLGRYGVFAETVRAGGGHQLSRSAFTLAAGVPPQAAPAGGVGVREVAGMRVDIAASTLVAGRDARLQFAFTQDGAPVRDLQAWLGMGGHLMLLGPATGPAGPDPTDPAESFAHVHDMDPPVQYGFGPVIGFSFTFPAAGRYQLWAQVQRHWQVITIPVTLDVAPAA